MFHAGSDGLMAWLYLVLMSLAFASYVIAIVGFLGDHNNRYPLPLMISALIAGCFALKVLDWK